jgi:hypothetical protein
MTSFERDFPYLYVFVQEDFTKLKSANQDDTEWFATVKEWNERYFNAVKTIVSQGIKSGELASTVPPGIIANAIIGMMDSSNVWFQPNGIMDGAEIGAGMAVMLLDGLTRRSTD